MFEQLVALRCRLEKLCSMRRRPAAPAAMAAVAALLGMALGQQAGAPSSGSYSSYALNATFTKGECPLSA